MTVIIPRWCMELLTRSARRGRREQAALAELGRGALGEVVRLLQVRLPGQDEVVDAERVVLLDPVGDLGVAARRSRTSAARRTRPSCRSGRAARTWCPVTSARTRRWPVQPGYPEPWFFASLSRTLVL